MVQQLGNVTVVSTSCPGGTGTVPNTVCFLLEITGQGAPLDVEVRISEPPGPRVGTVLVGTGSDGTDFTFDVAGGSDLVSQLLGLGFVVVDRRWSDVWWAEPSIKDAASRYAVLAKWVRDNHHSVGPMCATGNSGGAGEIAYALTHWGGDAIFDAVVLTSGPPFARLDYLCEDPASPAWAAQCPTLVPPGSLQCPAVVCTPDPVTLGPFCASLPASQADQLADSVLSPDAVLAYPTTGVHALFGDQDCSNSVPLGLLFLDSVQTAVTSAFVQGAPHLLTANSAGVEAIVAALATAAGVPVPATAPPSSSAYFEFSYDPETGQSLGVRAFRTD